VRFSCAASSTTPLLELVEMEVRRAARQYDFPVTTPHHPRQHKLAMEGDKGPLGEEAIMKLADALDTYIPMPKRAVVVLS
jgi:elongation factor Tu